MSEKVFVDINGERVELTGQELENFNKEVDADTIYQENKAKLEAEAIAARQAAEAKLATIGLTTDDLKALGL
jgi:hypothetical protein